MFVLCAYVASSLQKQKRTRENYNEGKEWKTIDTCVRMYNIYVSAAADINADKLKWELNKCFV